MESLLQYACEHAQNAHWVIFFLLLLAGLNVPLSEDVLLITGGVIAGSCIEENLFYFYAWLYFGCWFSAWEAYWIGRGLGPKLYDIKWFSRVLTPKKIKKLHHYYEKFGIFTFIVGRFIPGGVRNALFMTAGLGKMPFRTFIFRDSIGCLLSSSFLFWLGYGLTEHYDTLLLFLHRYTEIALLLIALLILAGLLYFWIKKRNR